jgi:hypothetical protein
VSDFPIGQRPKGPPPPQPPRSACFLGKSRLQRTWTVTHVSAHVRIYYSYTRIKPAGTTSKKDDRLFPSSLADGIFHAGLFKTLLFYCYLAIHCPTVSRSRLKTFKKRGKPASGCCCISAASSSSVMTQVQRGSD